MSDSVSALFDCICDRILFTHSQGGGPGWLTAIKNRVKSIVAFEPGSGFAFPDGEVSTMWNSPSSQRISGTRG